MRRAAVLKKAMSLNVKMQTYVAFIVPHESDPLKGIAVPFAVETRDIQQLDIPATACAFYFYDAPEGLTPQQSLGKKYNISKEYLLAHETLTKHQIKTLLAGEDYPSLEGRMQWDLRVERHETFIITRNNSVQPVTENHVVINSHRKQIYPELPANPDTTIDPATLSKLFNPVLQKDIMVPRISDVRRRGGNPKPPSP